jgi:hypothetical protein
MPNEITPIEISTLIEILKPNEIPIEINTPLLKNLDTNLKYTLNFKMVVRSFCFGLNTFSPFGINRQKQRT